MFSLERKKIKWVLYVLFIVCTVCKADHDPPSRCSATPDNRFDCAPEKVLNKDECEARGCCYVPDSLGPEQPSCYFPPDYPSYKMVNLTETENGYTATLIRNKKTFMPDDLMTLQLDIKFETEFRLHFTIKDPSQKRYEVPIKTPQVCEKPACVQYKITFTEEPFALIISRKSNGQVLLNTSVAPFLFADQFIQMSTSLPSKYLYGLGEHLTSINLNLNWKRFTFWNRDLIPREDANLYGTHPFYLGMEKDNSAHGVFLLNSNAMDIILQPAPALTWRTTGGILDFYVFLGPEPKAVMKQYLDVIGLPFMPPYWGLGFHLCRWGYTSSNMTREAVKNMREAKIPLDVQWNDIDYMDEYLDFTYDPNRFGDMPEMVDELHKMNMKYVIIMEPAIGLKSSRGTYLPYVDGLKRGVYITNATGQPLVGKVWPGLTTFVDFTNPEAHKWWYDMIKEFHEKVPFDGLWIDMNEPANNVHGSVDNCPDDKLENPPYVPAVVGGVLRDTTICASSQQYLSSHYNLHNMYGFTEAIATHDALVKIRGKRPFVISRSTFPSHGHYAGHWTGDLESTWKQLYFTVPAILLFNMYGVPLVGADLCGFVGNVTEELCVRWSQVGAFYPFMRNHNTFDASSQEPYVFSQEAQQAIKKSVELRYMLLPYLYNLFHKAHTSGDTVARALFMEFPSDPNTWEIDRQFLWGDALLITPVLEEGKTEVNAYFPAGVWYDIVTATVAQGSVCILQGEASTHCSPSTSERVTEHWTDKYHEDRYEVIQSNGKWLPLPIPLDTIKLHIRGGFIIPAQEPGMTTEETRKNKLILLVPLAADGSAQGDLYWDDGDSLDTYEKGDYSLIKFVAINNVLQNEVVHSKADTGNLKLGMVELFGIQSNPKEVRINGVATNDYKYTETTEHLTIENLRLPIAEKFEIEWSK